MKGFVFITLVAMASMANAGRSCPKFWNLFEGNCYRYFGDRITWTVAEARCNQDFTTNGNGHVTSVLSIGENRFVYELFRSSVGIDDIPNWENGQPFYGIWTGLQRGDGGWVNSDGSDQGSFENWRPNEPSNSGGVEDCVHIWRYNDNSDVTQDWNDKQCDADMAFVCKMPANGANCDNGPVAY